MQHEVLLFRRERCSRLTISRCCHVGIVKHTELRSTKTGWPLMVWYSYRYLELICLVLKKPAT